MFLGSEWLVPVICLEELVIRGSKLGSKKGQNPNNKHCPRGGRNFFHGFHIFHNFSLFSSKITLFWLLREVVTKSVPVFIVFEEPQFHQFHVFEKRHFLLTLSEIGEKWMKKLEKFHSKPPISKRNHTVDGLCVMGSREANFGSLKDGFSRNRETTYAHK